MPIQYSYPPLVPEDPTALADRLAAALGAAWDDIKRREQIILDSTNDLRRAEALETLRDLLAAVERFQAKVAAAAVTLRDRDIPLQYALGAQLAGPDFRWNALHEEAAALLAGDSYDDLLARSQEAGRTSERFAREVRQAARERVALQATGRYTSTQVGRILRDRLEAAGLSVVTYANGANVPMDVYTNMAVRTKAAVAANVGTLNRTREFGVEWVEVFDGADCGWTSHDDPDKPNATVRSVEQAAAYILAHPNCRRSFGPRPDVTSDREAADAQPSTTRAQRENQAQRERELAAASQRRQRARPDPAARRAGTAARRAERLATAAEVAQVAAPAAQTNAATSAALTGQDVIDLYGDRWHGQHETHADDLAAAPQVFHEVMRDHNVNVYVGEGGVPDLDEMGHLKGVTPRGWPPGSTWDGVPGAYDQGARKVILGDDHHGHGHGSTSLALHEGGHGMDSAIGARLNIPGGQAHMDPAFSSVHAETMSSPIGGSLNPYFTQEGWAGYSEAWAEGFAAWSKYNGDPVRIMDALGLKGVDLVATKVKLGQRYADYFADLQRRLEAL